MVTPAVDESGIDVGFVTSNLNRALTLISSNMAIFTFTLIFLYPRYALNELNGVLFQITLSTSLLVIFLLGITGVYYFEVIANKRMSHVQKLAAARRGDLLFVVSLIIMTSLPTLILFTLSITIVAIIATLLWALFTAFVIRRGEDVRNLWS